MNKADIYQRYINSNNYSLFDVYNTFSKAKAEAWQYCEEQLREKDGCGLKVIGANSNFFSAGFEFEEDGAKMFMYITHANDYVWEV